ncbi:MAG: hypothetical protein ACUZ8H_00935 [Candidatus Anammoxibacter sp.]
MRNVLGIVFATLLITAMCTGRHIYAYEGGDVSNGGTISGKALFLGDVPARVAINVTKDKDVCGAIEHLSDLLIVSAKKEIKNVIISIVDIEKGKKLEMPSSNPTLDQNGCVFKPHVICVPAGATIDILNSDTVTHNVHTYPEENSAMNKAQPPSLKKISIETEFGEEDPMKVSCDYHGWMSAWVGIFEHPYYAVTGDDGSFTLTNIPPGAYEVKAWQEDLGELIKTISVKAGETTTENFEFKK